MYDESSTCGGVAQQQQLFELQRSMSPSHERTQTRSITTIEEETTVTSSSSLWSPNAIFNESTRSANEIPSHFFRLPYERESKSYSVSPLVSTSRERSVFLQNTLSMRSVAHKSPSSFKWNQQ